MKQEKAKMIEQHFHPSVKLQLLQHKHVKFGDLSTCQEMKIVASEYFSRNKLIFQTPFGVVYVDQFVPQTLNFEQPTFTNFFLFCIWKSKRHCKIYGKIYLKKLNMAF